MARPPRTDELELTILMPCLNEERSIGACVGKAVGFLARTGIAGEVVVADNGSQDRSVAIAEELGARVVPVARRGYGAALQAGIDAAHGRFVIMGDSDDSYDFSRLDAFVDQLRSGHDLVMGNRFAGGIAPGSMPVLNRLLGNPALSWIGRRLFGARCGDFYCGLRGFSKRSIGALHLEHVGMEFALEMVVKATMFGLRVTEVPTTLSKDGRQGGKPHLRPWRDGWRSLRLFLVMIPRRLLFYPAVLLLLAGVVMLALAGGDPRLAVAGAAATVVATATVQFVVLSKWIAARSGVHPIASRLDQFARWLTFEHGLAAGALLVIAGAGALVGGIAASVAEVVAAATAITVGFQMALGGWLMGLLHVLELRFRR